MNAMVLVILFAAFLLSPGVAFAQECPSRGSTGLDHPSEPRTLEGRVIYHDSARQWYELVLTDETCGGSSIQLVATQDDRWKAIEQLRDCRVKVTGTLNFPATGYYSLEIYQDVEKIEASERCDLKPPLPDFSKEKPAKSIRRYRVDMHVNYGSDEPIGFQITSQGHELHPWQAYAGYYMTGSFLIYGSCAEGFDVDTVFGTPEASPSHFDEPRTADDRAVFDPENAASAGMKDLRLGFTCVRAAQGVAMIRGPT